MPAIACRHAETANTVAPARLGMPVRALPTRSRNGKTRSEKFRKTTIQDLRGKSPNWRAGAPTDNRNALKTGRYTKEALALRREVSAFLKRARINLALAKAAMEARRLAETAASPPARTAKRWMKETDRMMKSKTRFQ